MKHVTTVCLGLVFFLFMGGAAWGQVTGDYRTTVTGNWDNAAIWETYNGSTWSAAGVKPGAANNVFIQYSHIVTLTGNESCNDINTAVRNVANATVAGTIKIQTYTLQCYGKLRAYKADAGTIPGTDDASTGLVWGSTKWPIQTSTGKLQIAGDTRALTLIGQWGAGSSNAGSYSPNVEVALNSGQTVTLNTNMKMGNWTFTSGTFNADIRTVSADNGTAAASNISIGSGATLISSATSVFQRTGSGVMGTLTVDGNLELNAAAPAIAATTINFNGTVKYNLAGAQNLAIAYNAGANPVVYTNLIAANSGTKTTAANLVTWVIGTRTTEGSGSFALGTGASWGVYYKSSGSASDLTQTASWGDAADGSGNQPADFTTANQVFNIKNGSSYTLSSNWTVSGANAKIVLGNGTTATSLTVGSGTVLSGTVDVSNNSTLTVQTPNSSNWPTFGTNSGTISFDNISGFTLGGSVILGTGNYVMTNGTVDVGSNSLTVNGTLRTGTNIVSGAGTFVLGSSGSLHIGSLVGITGSGSTGNIQTGTRTFPTTASYTYTGASDQVTGNGLPATVGTMTVNLGSPSTKLTLSNSIAVTGQTTFTQGLIVLGNQSMTIATTSGSSANSYAVTNGSGSLIRNITSTGNKTLPVGSLTEFRSIGINFSATPVATNITAHYYSTNPGNTGAYPGSVTAHYGGGYWSITSDGIPGQTYTLTMETVSMTGMTDIASARILKRQNNSESWILAGTAVNTGTTCIESGISNFSEFAIGSISDPLPVELCSFSSTTSDMSVVLKWETTTENDNIGFEIEKRADNNWQKVGFVEGAGTTNGPSSYSYSIKESKSGTFWYRLKQIDRNGNFKYSKEIEAVIGMKIPKELTLSSNYPNPFNPTTNIEFTFPNEGTASLKVYNMLGQQVAELFNNHIASGILYRTTFDASHLSSGLYFSVLEFNGKKLTRKMLLTK